MGKVGSGKTSLIKYLCYTWAKATLQSEAPASPSNSARNSQCSPSGLATNQVEEEEEIEDEHKLSDNVTVSEGQKRSDNISHSSGSMTKIKGEEPEEALEESEKQDVSKEDIIASSQNKELPQKTGSARSKRLEKVEPEKKFQRGTIKAIMPVPEEHSNTNQSSDMKPSQKSAKRDENHDRKKRQKLDGIKNFKIVLALNMSYKDEYLPDIIDRNFRDDYKVLKRVLERVAIIEEIEKDPDCALLFIDGYIPSHGEQNLHVPVIEELVTGKEWERVLCTTTIRPEFHRDIKKTLKVKYEIFETNGFNESQQKNYVQKILSENHEKTREFLEHTNKPEYSSLKQNPLCLELMCVSYDIYQDLGKRKSEIYYRYITALLLKYQEEGKHIGWDDLLQTFENELKQLGKLANSWNEDGSLKQRFEETDVQTEFHPFLTKLGCLYLTQPEHLLSKTAHWEFWQRSIQEYLIYYYISHSDPQVERDFIEQCGTGKGLKERLVVLKFFCEENSQQANGILQQAVVNFSDDRGDMNRTQHILSILLDEFPNIDLAKFPVFKTMNIESGDPTNYAPLFKMDSKLAKSNLSRLDIVLGNDTRLFYSENSEERKSQNKVTVYELMSKLPQITTLKEFSVSIDVDIERHIGSRRKQKTLSVPIANTLKNMKQIEGVSLQVTASQSDLVSSPVRRARSVTLVEPEEMEGILKNGMLPKLKKLDMTGNKLTRKFYNFAHSFTIPQLVFSNCCLDNSDLGELVHKLCHTDVGKKVTRQLDISQNDFSVCKNKLRSLFHNLPKLQDINLSRCKLSKDTLLVGTTISKHITKLNLAGNHWTGSGSSLLELAQNMPNLEDLDLSDGKLSLKDIFRMSRDHGELEVNEGLSRPEINKDSAFANIKSLNLSKNYFADRNIQPLILWLKEMKKLAALGLSECGFNKCDDLVLLIKNLPQCFEYLDLSQNKLEDKVCQLMVKIKTLNHLPQLEKIVLCKNGAKKTI